MAPESQTILTASIQQGGADAHSGLRDARVPGQEKPSDSAQNSPAHMATELGQQVQHDLVTQVPADI